MSLLAARFVLSLIRSFIGSVDALCAKQSVMRLSGVVLKRNCFWKEVPFGPQRECFSFRNISRGLGILPFILALTSISSALTFVFKISCRVGRLMCP